MSQQTAADGSEGSDLVGAYSVAIFEVARAEGVLDLVEEQLFRFARALDRSDELRETLNDAAIPSERRQAIVEELLGKRFLPLTSALVSFVVAAGRARSLTFIIDRFVERAASSRRQVVAEVRSAVPLADETLRRLADALSANLGKEVEVKLIIDPSVIGGLAARVGDTVIDGTVRHRLEELRERIST